MSDADHDMKHGQVADTSIDISTDNTSGSPRPTRSLNSPSSPFRVVFEAVSPRRRWASLFPRPKVLKGSTGKRILSESSVVGDAAVGDAALADEYGQMDSSGCTLHVPSFELESSQVLVDVQVVYQTYGTLSPTGDNAIFVAHALTGNAALHSWWARLLGEGKPLDTSKYFVICANVLGSCYGSTGPTSLVPKGGAPWAQRRDDVPDHRRQYGADFPPVTIRDTVRSLGRSEPRRQHFSHVSHVGHVRWPYRLAAS